jgi:hypothetical protein
MGCYYWVGSFRFPKEKQAEVEALIEKLDLRGTFAITEGEISQEDGTMASSTANDISDDLIPEIAKMVKGTEFDGQVNDTEYDGGDNGTIVLINGEAKTFGSNTSVIELTGPTDYKIQPGEETSVPVTVKVIGLGGQKVLVIEVKG